LNKLIKDKDTEIHSLEIDNRRLTNSLDLSQRVFDDYEQICREKRSLQSQLNSVESTLFNAQTEMTGLVRYVWQVERCYMFENILYACDNVILCDN
jgi:hypothetical protein